MAARKTKQPKGTIPGRSKDVRGMAPGEAVNEQISWRVSVFDAGGPWGAGNEPAEAALKVYASVQGFESMTWGTMAQGRDARVKRIPVGNLCKDAQKRLEEIKQDDAEALWELRLGGKPRLWGTRAGGVFTVLWWDPDHEVCPSNYANN